MLSRVEMANLNSAWISPDVVIVHVFPLERILRECLIWRGGRGDNEDRGKKHAVFIARIVGFWGSPRNPLMYHHIATKWKLL